MPYRVRRLYLNFIGCKVEMPEAPEPKGNTPRNKTLVNKAFNLGRNALRCVGGLCSTRKKKTNNNNNANRNNAYYHNRRPAHASANTAEVRRLQSENDMLKRNLNKLISAAMDSRHKFMIQAYDVYGNPDDQQININTDLHDKHVVLVKLP